MAPVVARNVFVDGRVKASAFAGTRAEARALGLTGWVRNLADGRVEVWCEGPAEAVRALEDWLARGPSGGHVTEVEVRDVVPCHPSSFEIRR